MRKEKIGVSEISVQGLEKNRMDKIQSMFEKEVTGSRNVPGKSCNVALHKYQLPNVRDENLLHGDVKYE
jgi:predicted transcriptional regulator